MPPKQRSILKLVPSRKVSTTETKRGRDSYILIFELILVIFIFGLLLAHFFLTPILDDFSPAYGELPSIQTPGPTIRVVKPKPQPDEMKFAKYKNSRDLIGENSDYYDNYETTQPISIERVEVVTSTPENSTQAQKTNYSMVEPTMKILKNSTDPTLKPKQEPITVDRFISDLNLDNISFIEDKLRKISYLSTADSSEPHNETLLSTLLIMYPTTMAAFVMISMRLTCIMANDPMHKATKWGFIIFGIGLGISIFATSVRSLITQESIILIIIALGAVVLIVIEAVNFILLALKVGKA